MTNSPLSARRFEFDDQVRFAQLTGDRNPLHLDRRYSRRTQAGEPVVHGIHGVLWALEELAANGLLDRPVAMVTADFRRYLYLSTEVALWVRRADDRGIRAELVSDGFGVTAVALAFGPSSTSSDATTQGVCEQLPPEPKTLSLEMCASREGRFTWADSPIALLFPLTSRRLGRARVESLAALSPLVGMICPGLHSIFHGVRLQSVHPIPQSTEMSYRVKGSDERFHMLTMAVQGGGWSGSVDAFVSWPPIEQPTLEAVRQVVTPDAFATTTALIVGGSRGLGALTARVIVAGGGRVILTYAVGAAEADQLARELGADASAIQAFDVHHVETLELSALRWPVDHVYYFASPQIQRQQAYWYSAERFHHFCTIYIDRFEALCRAIAQQTTHPVRVFYPSSVAISEQPAQMTEYAMAKVAGEFLCAKINHVVPNITVYVERLPRLMTDQTATPLPTEAADALASVIGFVSAMHRQGGANLA